MLSKNFPLRATECTEMPSATDVSKLFYLYFLTKTMDPLDQHVSIVITCLIHPSLISEYLLFNSQVCEQKDRIAMESHVSIVIDNYNLQQLKRGALNTAILKPSCLFWYVNNSFGIYMPYRCHPITSQKLQQGLT
jgi:hypothetical protein